MKTTSLLVLSVSLLGLISTSKGTTEGLPDPSYGILWDTFSGVTFSEASGTGSNPYMSATLTSANGAGLLTGEGDRLYSGSGGSTAVVDMNISGTATVALDSLTVFLKYTPASGSDQILDYFTVTLDGNAASQYFVGTGQTIGTSPNEQVLQIVGITWTGLSINALDTFNVSIDRAAAGLGQPGHVSIDAVQIVPEPSTGVLVGMALALACIRRRRNRQKISPDPEAH